MSGHILVCGSGHLIHPFIRQLVTPSFASTCEEDAAGNTLPCVFRGLGLCEPRGCIGVVNSGQPFPERLFPLYISTIAVHGLPAAISSPALAPAYHVTVAIEDVE